MKFKKQMSGLTLAITLIILFMVTLIGVTSMRTSAMEEKMSSNFQDKELSFQAAESALIAGEKWLLNLTEKPTPTVTCNSYPCVNSLDTTLFYEEQTANWWSSNSASYTTGTLKNIATPPKYRIEFYRFVADSPGIGKGVPNGNYYYRVTAKGSGSSNDANSIIQTSVARRY